MLEAGTILQNRYLVERQIGAGGMGTVYIATDQRFGTRVAIKETLFAEDNLRKAFEREAQLLNSLRHPALPRVSDHFEENSGLFIVMEYIAGDDLAEMSARNGGAFAVADVLRWADQLLDALDYLHNQKSPIVHRDIKPQNLKLTVRKDIVLLDFGLAKGSASELSQLSMAKSVFGYSRSYAPLEQIQGTGTDPRSDLYSLAATVYHLLTGKPPVDALTRATAVLGNDADPLLPAHRLNPKVSVAVAQILHQAMALNAKVRPATAAKMRFALTEAGEKPADAGTFVNVESFPVAAELFTQNTELMADAGKTAALNTAGETNLKNAVTNPNAEEPEAQTQIRAAVANAPRRRSSLAPLGIAALVILLGGFGYALYNNGLTVSFGKTAEIPKDNLLPESPVAADTPAANTELVQQSNTAAQSNTANETPRENGKNPVASQPDKTAAAKEKQPPVAQNAPGSKPKVDSGEDETGFEELEELGDRIERQMEQGGKTDGQGLDAIPPELRSNDPKNPVDARKLKIFVQKQQQEAHRRIREANRLRREQGLPAIENPKRRKIVIQNPPPENQPPSSPPDKKP